MNTVIPHNTKWTFTTRNVVKTDVTGLDTDVAKASSGDLVLAKIARIGSHKRVQLESGRNSTSHTGDIIVLCCGARYAPDQFEGIAKINPEQADLLAGGGIIGTKRASHGAMRNPTQLIPLGLLTDANGSVMNIKNYALKPVSLVKNIQVIAVTGTAMNSGKTTTAYSLVNGLTKLGKTVAALKVTGTGAFGDFNAFSDAGARTVYDFTDAGMATTYQQSIERIVSGALTLIAQAHHEGADVAIVELGDGILQKEAWQLLNHPTFSDIVDRVLFAAPDALSAIAGLQYLEKTNLTIAGVSGLLTRSPLLCSEYEQVIDVPLYTKNQLSSAQTAQLLCNSVEPLVPAELLLPAQQHAA